MQQPRGVAADSDIRIHYGRGAEPVTVAQLDRTLRFVAAMQKKQRAPGVHPQVASPRERRAQRSRRSPSRGDPSEPDLDAVALVEQLSLDEEAESWEQWFRALPAVLVREHRTRSRVA